MKAPTLCFAQCLALCQKPGCYPTSNILFASTIALGLTGFPMTLCGFCHGSFAYHLFQIGDAGVLAPPTMLSHKFDFWLASQLLRQNLPVRFDLHMYLSYTINSLYKFSFWDGGGRRPCTLTCLLVRRRFFRWYQLHRDNKSVGHCPAPLTSVHHVQ